MYFMSHQNLLKLLKNRSSCFHYFQFKCIIFVNKIAHIREIIEFQFKI